MTYRLSPLAAWQIVVVSLGGALSAASCLAEDTPRPRAVLERAGFREARDRWTCRGERRLIRQIRQAAQIEEEYTRAYRAWQAYGEEQHRLRRQLASWNQSIERFDDEIVASSANPLRRQRLEDKQRQLRSRLVKQQNVLRNKLGSVNESSTFSMSARRLAAVRSQLEATRIAIRTGLAEQNAWYASVGQPVREALAQLNAKEGGAQFGPISDYSETVPPILQRLHRLAVDDRVPIFRAAGRFRVSAVINETAPVSFGIDDELDFAVASVDILKAAGLDTSAGGERLEIELGAKRFVGCLIRARSLRFGPLVLRDVRFLAVEHGSDTGGPLLAASLLDGPGVDWDFDRLEIRLPRD